MSAAITAAVKIRQDLNVDIGWGIEAQADIINLMWVTVLGVSGTILLSNVHGISRCTCWHVTGPTMLHDMPPRATTLGLGQSDP
jgi:hypothetical protein